jgi:LEA14-like dessication related protein
MKKILLFCIAAAILQSCGINKQTNQIKALEKCVYDLVSADSIYVAGTDMSQMIRDRNVDLRKLPRVALGLLRRDVPLTARLNLKVSNPTADLASINQFEYIVLIKDQQIANGFVDQKVVVSPGGTTNVPVKLNANIYQILSNGKTMDQIFDFIQGGSGNGTERKGIVTVKIKPTIQVGKKLVKYPGYITIDKEISSKILF